MAKNGTNSNCITYWPNLEPILVASAGYQILNLYRWNHVQLDKFGNKVAFYLAGKITQVKESIPWVRCASGNVSLQARTAHNLLRMGKYGTYLELNRSEEAPEHCQTLDSLIQCCAWAHFRLPPCCRHVAAMLPPVWLPFPSLISFRQWIHMSETRNAVAIKLTATWWQHGGNMVATQNELKHSTESANPKFGNA